MKTLNNKARAGFSLIELVVTMTILAILVGVVSFRSGAVIEKSKVTKVIQLIDTLQSACALHHADTGEFALEYTGYAAQYRELSAVQATPQGHNGPYLDGPLTANHDNPFGNLHLYNNPKANNWIPGFDVDGDGTLDVDTALKSNMLYLVGFNEANAKLLEEAFDDHIPGTWSDTGMVRYKASNSTVYVLVHH